MNHEQCLQVLDHVEHRGMSAEAAPETQLCQLLVGQMVPTHCYQNQCSVPKQIIQRYRIETI